jgi:tetratricopeptide (TPR) repeat protein
MKFHKLIITLFLLFFSEQNKAQSLNFNEIDFLISNGRFKLAQTKLDEIQKSESDPRLKLIQSRLWEEEAEKLQELGDYKGALGKLERANKLWSNRSDLILKLERTRSAILENSSSKYSNEVKNETAFTGSDSKLNDYSDIRSELQFIFYIVIISLLFNIITLYLLLFRNRHV